MGREYTSRERALNHPRSSASDQALRTLRKLIKRFGLNYDKIAAYLGFSPSKVERLVLFLERSHPEFVEKSLKGFRRRLKRTGQRWRRQEHGLFPLEYYLCASYT